MPACSVEAVLGAPDVGAVYSHYRGENLPDTGFLNNTLRDAFKIPIDKIAEFVDIFYDTLASTRNLTQDA
ncbi:MAG: hypothetical protein GEV08_19135 [Acidimicrobiia bacterium]|nr:hypothetical protein [Acidimicrobiia bacterium]